VTVDAPEWLQSENIRYRLLYVEPTRVRYYAQDRWLVPPPALLAQRLSLSQGTGGLRLKIRLLEFEQVFDTPQTARVILAFRATATPPDNEMIVAEKVFKMTQATANANAEGAVVSSARIIGEAVGALQNWLVEIAVRR
jgi:cholesterol transport system auxiliary component